jgi:lysophospholipase L1-like esterase
MKKLLKSIKTEEWLVGLAVALVTYLVVSNRKPSNEAKSRVTNKIKNKPPKSILIVGDSYSIVGTPSKPIKFTYPNIVKKELEPKGITVETIAQGGQTTKWMLQKLTEALEKKKYDRVYVWGGTNDGVNMVTPEKVVENLQKMVDIANAKGTDISILKGYKIDGYMSADKLYNSGGFPSISKNQWVTMIDNFKKVKAKINADNIKNANFVEEFNLGDKTGDGSHPNPEGHKIIAQAVLDTI